MFGNASLLAHAYVAILLGALAAPRSMFGGLEYRGLLVWLSILPIVVFLKESFYIVFAFLGLLALATPSAAIERIKFFVLVVPAAPLYIHAVIGLPGINDVFDLDFYNGAVLAVLLPVVLMSTRARTKSVPWSFVDICIVLYVIYCTLQMVLTYGVVSGGRFMLAQTLVFVVPYFAIRRVVSSPRDARAVFEVFIVAASILAVIAIISAYKRWDFYRISDLDVLGGFVEMRDGRLRIQATLNTHSLAFVALLGILFLQFVKQYTPISFIRLWGLRVLLFVAALAPGSKGPLLAAAIGVAVYCLLLIRSGFIRWSLIAICGIGGSVLVHQLMFGDLTDLDGHGSIGYRQRLLETSLEFIADYPLFGDLRFLETGRFEHLIQGQGIVDVTNMYLQILLKYGFVGAFLFFTPILLVLSQLGLRAMSLSGKNLRDKSGIRGACAVTCVGLFAWLILITTTSDVGLVLHLGVFLLAVGEGIRARRTIPFPDRRLNSGAQYMPSVGQSAKSSVYGN